MLPDTPLRAILAVIALLTFAGTARAQELRIASHGTLGGGASQERSFFDLAGGLSLTAAWNPEQPWRLGPWCTVGTNRNIHSNLATGLMGVWRSSRSTSWAVVGAAGAIVPIHDDPSWKTGVTARTAVVLWYEDEGRTFSVASPTVGLGVEVRSIPGVAGHDRENEAIVQLSVDPFAALVYIPFLIGSAIYGLPH